MRLILRLLLGWLKWIAIGVLGVVVMVLIKIPFLLIDDGINSTVQTVGWILIIFVILPFIAMAFYEVFGRLFK